MISALSGFALIGVIVGVGWAVRRWGNLPAETESVVGRLVYSILTPCLLFTSASAADLRLLFSEPLLVSAAAAFVVFGLHTVSSRGRDRGTKIIGALSAGYNNAGYIGIPVATYMLGDPALVVPIVMLQLLVITPLALTLLEIATTGHASWRTTLTAPLRMPLAVAVVLGAVVSVTGLHIPTVIATPIATMGDAAVPLVLIAFGMSLSGRRVLAAGPERTPTIAAVVLKTTVMPATAFLLAVTVRLPSDAVYAVTVLAALPTAQNIYIYAQRFGTGLVVARDAIFLSTIASVPALLAIVLLIHP